MSKTPVDFVAAMRSHEEREGVQRHPKPAAVLTPASSPPPPAAQAGTPASKTVQRSRIGKVSIGVWVDPAVRKQLAQLALDTDKDQSELMAEALNLLFERYGKPTIVQVG
jgi:hypothetical protein